MTVNRKSGIADRLQNGGRMKRRFQDGVIYTGLTGKEKKELRKEREAKKRKAHKNYIKRQKIKRRKSVYSRK